MTEISLKPKGHYILIELVTVKEVSKGGIILVDSAKEQKATQFAKVIGIGPTAFVGVDGCNPMSYPPGHENYTKQPHEIWGLSVGDTVFFNRYEGSDVNVANIKNYRVIPDTQLTLSVHGDFEITKADF